MRQVLRLVYGREALWVASRATQTGRGIKWLFKRLRGSSKKRRPHLEPTLETTTPATSETQAPADPELTIPEPAIDDADARFRA